MTLKIRRRRTGSLRRPSRRLEHVPAGAEGGSGDGSKPPTLDDQIDGRIDERFDAETTKSNVAIVLSGFALLMAAVAGVTIFAVAGDDSGDGTSLVVSGGGDTTAAGQGQADDAPATAPSGANLAAENWEAIDFESYKRPDPTLPAVPPGAVKKFDIDVYEHVTKVSDELAPTRVWSYAVNGKDYRGTGVSAPLVVNQGDKVEMSLTNGGSEKMDVQFPHSIDFHSSEIAPNEAFVTVPPGGKHEFSFTAKHPGVYMYHCATDPVLMHTGAGMVGMMIVKPNNIAPVDHELWITQQEYYLGEAGEDPDMGKMEAKRPDVIAFNGYANQYKEKPITVGRGDSVRMYVMNAGPSVWSAFHMIGTVFDRTVVEGAVGADAQTVNLAPSQGGWVEFTLDKEGVYPFVTHGFGDMVKGAAGAVATKNPDVPAS